MISKAPIYTLKTVLKETGLKADVLRVWERRYNIPRPQRSPGGHRLYSDYDIAVVRWLRSRQEEGLSISQAVELWKKLVENETDPLENMPMFNTITGSAHMVTDARIEALRSQWLNACMEFDGRKAEDVLNQAFALYPVEKVCIEILQKSVSLVGERWFSGSASVQQEHFTSAQAVRRLEALILATPNPTRVQSILLACPAGETHLIPTLLLYLLLRRRGLKVINLGAEVPIEEINETLAAIRPDLVVLAAQHLVSAAALSIWAESLREQNIPVAYGGLVFNRVPALRERISAWFLGEDLEQSIDQIERLAMRPQVYPHAANSPVTTGEAAMSYRLKRPLIEFDFMHRLGSDTLPTAYMAEVINYFGSGLAAALELGDPSFLEPDLEWIARLLARRHIPTDQLTTFLLLYREAVQSVLGEDGDMLTRWLDRQTASH
jgi:DNA-binding transcriptional MerR regulator